jgi:pimeloyl-ACP methyl ester carboxylesterase
MTITSFRGFDCANFTFNGRSCKVVRPRRPAPGLPWVWRARFWGVEPQTDVALLERGFHVVYCDVAELFGNAEAIDLWDAFYRKMRRAGLARKACLEGFSRGGVYVYNWALANPGKVAAVYADAPVLDLKSWPGGKGQGPGSPADWDKFKKHYGFTTDEQALQFKGNPLDNAARLAKAGYPMLHVVGDADEVVPVAENTTLFAARVKAAGGQITVIHKPGVGHHPHSLANPSPIVNFILQAVGMKGISY